MSNSILLADDDAALRHLLGCALQAEGYDVIPARTAREAIQVFLHQTPDLVLLDLKLPEKDGWEVLQFMQQLRPWMPVIVITGRPDQFARASRLGAAGLMEKPLDLPLMFRAVENMLEKSNLERVEHEMESFYDEVPHSPPPCCLLTTGIKPPRAVEHFAAQIPA